MHLPDQKHTAMPPPFHFYSGALNALYMTLSFTIMQEIQYKEGKAIFFSANVTHFKVTHPLK